MIFLTDGSPFYSPTHAEIAGARIAYLWAEPANRRSGREVLGTAAIPRPPQGGDAWARARFWLQVDQWFGSWWPDAATEDGPARPDFLITLSAPWWRDAQDVDALRLLKHELLHCCHKVDEYGAPRFNAQTGEPLWGIRGHDVEEFAEAVEWFGPTADVARLIEAASKAPLASGQSIARACGTCLRVAA